MLLGKDVTSKVEKLVVIICMCDMTLSQHKSEVKPSTFSPFSLQTFKNAPKEVWKKTEWDDHVTNARRRTNIWRLPW